MVTSMLVHMINTTALREARNARGLSQSALAKLAGVSQQLIGQLERGEVLKTQSIYRIAAVLGIPAQQLDNEIPGAEESERRTIPLVGYVGAGAEIFAIDDHAKGGGLEEVECPWTALAPSTVAVKVRGTSMVPAYHDGDILFYETQHTDFRHLLGKECVVALADGRKFVKELRRTSAGQWYLHSHNAEPIVGSEIEWAAKVRLIQRAD